MLCKNAAVASVALCSLVVLQAAAPSGQPKKARLDKNEAKAAFEYLNRVRKDPPSFSKEIGADLKDVKAMPALKWNATLAKVAEQKALDMAKRNYFGHLNPEGLGINILMHEAGYKLPKYMLENKKANNFESLGGGLPNGKETIRRLILDKGVENIGHRKHLLGIDTFEAQHKNVGIGFARNPKSQWKTYICVIIAHQP